MLENVVYIELIFFIFGLLGSISPTFYVQLLRPEIPKAQKDSQLKQLFALLGPMGVKAARKHIDEIDPSDWS